MGYITTKKSVKSVRLVVTDDLVSVIGKKNLMASLETKDNRVATERAPAVIAKFQQQITDARAKLAGYVYVPATLHAEIVTHLTRRGGFGGRMMLKSEAERLPPPDTSPVIVEPPPEAIEAIYQARHRAEQREVVTATDDPVRFESMVELWARENKVPDHTKRLYLSKTTRFVEWLKLDRERRCMAAALATQFATCSIALALVNPVERAFGDATACGNSGARRWWTEAMRLPGNAAICSHRFATIGWIRVGESRRQE